MPSRTSYTLIYAPEVLEHLGAIERKHHSLIREKVDDQLTFEPEVITRNSKPLDQSAPFGSTWELRFGPGNRFRVFYETDAEERVVTVLAIGVKHGNRLLIGGEELEL